MPVYPGAFRTSRSPVFLHQRPSRRPRDRISDLCPEYRPAPPPHCHDLSGFVGEITFEGDLGEFWPFSVLGQFVHVGNNALSPDLILIPKKIGYCDRICHSLML